MEIRGKGFVKYKVESGTVKWNVFKVSVDVRQIWNYLSVKINSPLAKFTRFHVKSKILFAEKPNMISAMQNPIHRLLEITTEIGFTSSYLNN